MNNDLETQDDNNQPLTDNMIDANIDETQDVQIGATADEESFIAGGQPEEDQLGNYADPTDDGLGYVGEDDGYFSWVEDTDGDGVIDAIHEEYDFDGDGFADYRSTYHDYDGNGTFESLEEELDSDGDGHFDIKYSATDITGDNEANIIVAQQDTNGSGTYDTLVQQQDLDGDGNFEYVAQGRDYNDDGVFDSYRIYEDTDMNGRIDMMSEYYDSNHDGVLDKAEIHYDYDEDGRNDWTQTYNYDPKTGNLTPINDTPAYGETIGGTYYYELPQYDPTTSNPEAIVGDPSSSMEHWEPQGETNRCALFSQKFIIEEFTGQDIDIEDFEAVAEENGWFDNGTTFLNVNKMLDYYGIENEMTFHNDINDIEDCLEQGGRVIVAIDADEIWFGQGDDLFSPNSGANHAVEVIGIDYSDPSNPMVILNDSGTPYGCGEMVPLDVFMDAWQDSECQMIACYPSK